MHSSRCQRTCFESLSTTPFFDLPNTCGVVTCKYPGRANGRHFHPDNFSYYICGAFLNLTFALQKHIPKTGNTNTKGKQIIKND